MGMSLTERISRASARRPKTVIAIWLLAVIGAIGINGALLAGALTTDINFLSNPDSKVGREWKYLFVTESQVKQAKGSWEAMKALGI